MNPEVDRIRGTERWLCVWAMVWGGLLVVAGAGTLWAGREKPGGLALIITGLITAGTGAWGRRQPTAAILALAAMSLMSLTIHVVLFRAMNLATPLAWASLGGAALNGTAFLLGAMRSGRLDGSLVQVMMVAALPALHFVAAALMTVRAYDWPRLALIGGVCVTTLAALASRVALKQASSAVAPPSSWLHVAAAFALALGLGWSATQYSRLLLAVFGPSPIGAALPPDGVPFALRFAAFVLWIPAAEEYLFRGKIQGTLTALWGDAPGVLATALLFTTAHVAVLAHPLLLVMGLALGLFRHASGSLLPGLVFHAAYNGVILLEA